MLKIKTLRAASKRFKNTASGKFKYKHAYKRHILTKKTKKHKRQLRKTGIFSNIYTTTIRKFLPYI